MSHLRAAAFAMHWRAAHEKGDVRSATTWIERGLQEFPKDRTLLIHRGSNLIASGHLDEARALFKKLLQEIDADDVTGRALLMNDIACVDALTGTKELLDEADEYSDHALKVFPWSTSIKGTRGAVFVRRGQLADGIALLEDSLQESEERGGRWQNACWLAMAESQRGNRNQAKQYLDLARELRPEGFLLGRAEGALNESADEVA